ncbi:uncharacterized protein LOC124544043 [Vanessa cardui]|uniref:uncharacterized protein LOC124544043 n=1 Tax=Vanessa cardui TaxID=171605 RepID=UPI001F137B0F|nr:uncharacterized protein LOC124544043 [Vanessa cardui]
MSSSKPKRAMWSEENLKAAVNDVSCGRLSSYKASAQYGVPRRTIRNHIKSGILHKSLGRNAIFTKEQEKDFVSRIIKFSEMGIPLTSKMIRIQAFAFCAKYNISNNFNKATGLAGKGWFRLFLQRNPNLAKRKVQLLNPARAQKLNKTIVTHHFNEVRKLYDEFNLHYRPEKIYNMDEKGCRLTLHHQQTVIAQKGVKRVHMIGSEHGENVTVVGCVNAIGNPIPPMILFKGKRKKPEYEDNLPVGSIVHMAPKGSMTTELFIIFIEHLANYKTPGKCLLIFDDAKCHLDFRIAEVAEKHEIVLYCLPSNTTHELQPLDKACYKPFESYWDQEVLQHMYQTRAKNVTKTQFNLILSKVWSKSMTYENITNGFKATGLYPLNAQAIPDSAFAPSILTERRFSKSNSNNSAEPQENFTGSNTNFETDTDSRQSSPIGNIQHLQNLINAESVLPSSPTTPDLRVFSSASPIDHSTPPRINNDDQNCLENIPGPSGLQINHRLVEYSDSTENEQDSISSEDNMYAFINRLIPPRRLRIYTSSDTDKSDVENINPNNVTLPKSDGEDIEDDEPLAKIARLKKTDFQKFMPTPDYSIVKNRPRKKALNYKGQRVTKDLFNTDKEPKKNNSNNKKKGKKPIKKTDKQKRKSLIKTKSTEDREQWYCLACKEERIADMRQCVGCRQWYHEDCVGLTKSDLDAFICPNCQKN